MHYSHSMCVLLTRRTCFGPQPRAHTAGSNDCRLYPGPRCKAFWEGVSSSSWKTLGRVPGLPEAVVGRGGGEAVASGYMQTH